MAHRALLLIACLSCSPRPQVAQVAGPSPRVANLHAFARLYGVLRWFHPSDAAAAVDWDRFAIDGARRVVDAPNAAALRDALAELSAPFAPTVRIAVAGEALVDDPALHPASTAGLELVAWEHQGFGDSTLVSAYQSKRRHRSRSVGVGGNPFAAVSQSVDATPYRGARVRLRAKIRADAGGGGGQLWLRVDRASGHGFFDNMGGRAITAAAWSDAEIIGTVDADATALTFGALVSGSIGAWFDAFELAVQDGQGAWKPIAIADPSFEAADVFASWRAGIGKSGALDGWDVVASHEQPAIGAGALHIAAKQTVLVDELFADTPRAGETVDIDLGSGLRARVPIALYSHDGHTLGDRSATRPPAQPTPTATGYDALAGAADVIVAWNVIEHFWPYWDDVKLDWLRELDVALAEALADRSVDEHVATLQRLAAAAPDGHANVTCPGATQMTAPPVALEWIEGSAVVTTSADDRVRVGDVVTAVDGRSVVDALAAVETRISGSPQWRRARAMGELVRGPDGSTVTLRIHRDTGDVDVALVRHGQRPDDAPHHAPIEQLTGGVWYVDLARANMTDVDAAMAKLAAAPGVVFDMRGYPNGTHGVLGHLLTQNEATRWMWIPKIIRPDHVAHDWDGVGWNMTADAPHIAGRVAVLTGPRAISYAESVMGFFEHFHLAAIVGAATAGTNGNVAQIREPTGCSTIFTGMRVTKHDGGRHHLIGVVPTVPAARTIAGVRAGKDEVLDRALELVAGAR